MRIRLSILSILVLALLCAPNLFATCRDCPNGDQCIIVTYGAGYICYWYSDGTCSGLGGCPGQVASLRSEYRVAAVRVLAPGQALPQPQAKAPVLTAAK